MSTPTSVYRYYDSDGALVYVGITSKGPQRQSQHTVTAEWWPHVARQDVEHYPSRDEAAARERELIQRFRPPFNVQHNPEHEAVRDAYLKHAARRAPLERTDECSPCPGDLCEWNPWGLRVIGCGRVDCITCHADWHGQQRTWPESRSTEAEEFLAFISGRTIGTDERVAAAAREILRLGQWLTNYTRELVAEDEDDHLNQRRAEMLARHFVTGFATAELEGLPF